MSDSTSSSTSVSTRAAGVLRALRETYELNVTLVELPDIWRRLRVPSDILLAHLHSTLQIAFDWDDQHLHCFERSGVRYGTPDDDDRRVHDQSGIRLGTLIAETGETLHYIYDFGDWWDHRVELVAKRHFSAADTQPHCLAGARAGPPEDCGGPVGFRQLLAVLADPAHDDYAAKIAWLDGFYFPDHFDAADVNRRLSRFLGRGRRK